ncbi:dentin sialophosphoprotein-like [Macrobrachium rosenbergii]|uniref:dentin sialophosphoprotein-like n=1 Tax=Macrobrachium rosenbergii TaxID=79674 RepID=UPI0034D558E6
MNVKCLVTVVFHFCLFFSDGKVGQDSKRTGKWRRKDASIKGGKVLVKKEQRPAEVPDSSVKKIKVKVSERSAVTAEQNVNKQRHPKGQECLKERTLTQRNRLPRKNALPLEIDSFGGEWKEGGEPNGRAPHGENCFRIGKDIIGEDGSEEREKASSEEDESTDETETSVTAEKHSLEWGCDSVSHSNSAFRKNSFAENAFKRDSVQVSLLPIEEEEEDDSASESFQNDNSTEGERLTDGHIPTEEPSLLEERNIKEPNADSEGKVDSPTEAEKSGDSDSERESEASSESIESEDSDSEGESETTNESGESDGLGSEGESGSLDESDESGVVGATESSSESEESDESVSEEESDPSDESGESELLSESASTEDVNSSPALGSIEESQSEKSSLLSKESSEKSDSSEGDTSGKSSSLADNSSESESSSEGLVSSNKDPLKRPLSRQRDLGEKTNSVEDDTSVNSSSDDSLANGLLTKEFVSSSEDEKKGDNEPEANKNVDIAKVSNNQKLSEQEGSSGEEPTDGSSFSTEWITSKESSLQDESSTEESLKKDELLRLEGNLRRKCFVRPEGNSESSFSPSEGSEKTVIACSGGNEDENILNEGYETIDMGTLAENSLSNTDVTEGLHVTNAKIVEELTVTDLEISNEAFMAEAEAVKTLSDDNTTKTLEVQSVGFQEENSYRSECPLQNKENENMQEVQFKNDLVQNAVIDSTTGECSQGEDKHSPFTESATRQCLQEEGTQRRIFQKRIAQKTAAMNLLNLRKCKEMEKSQNEKLNKKGGCAGLERFLQQDIKIDRILLEYKRKMKDGIIVHRRRREPEKNVHQNSREKPGQRNSAKEESTRKETKTRNSVRRLEQ